jgi:hypothetical protein
MLWPVGLCAAYDKVDGRHYAWTTEKILTRMSGARCSTRSFRRAACLFQKRLAVETKKLRRGELS